MTDSAGQGVDAIDAKDIERSINAVKLQQAAIAARDDLMAFTKFTSPTIEEPDNPDSSTYKNARHHDATAQVMEQVERGEFNFLVLVMAPRHGKSELASRRFPAWFAGRNPNQSVVVATYNDDFANDFGREVRTIMQSPRYRLVFPQTRFAKGGTASDRLNLLGGGSLFFVGRGGSLTGRGGHVMIFDDLIKDAAEAQSPSIRQKAWEWFTKVAMTRRMGKKLVIMTFTRWHEDDPIGRLTDPDNPHYSARLAKKIKIINFPAIAEEDDVLGREVGEALWPDGPDKYDIDFLEDQRDLDPAGFAALYQGRPTAQDGDLFERDNLRFYDTLPDNLQFYGASDHAVATGQRNDYTVLLKFGVDPQGNIYLVDCWWQRKKADVVVEAFLEMARGNMAPLVWWAESGHISKSIGPFLKKRMVETNTYMAIREIVPVNNKVQRAQSIAGRAGMGKLFLPRAAVWTERAIGQMMSFPNGTHDDFVDTLSLIGLGLGGQFSQDAPDEPERPPEFGTLAWSQWNDAGSETEKRDRGGF